MTPEQLAADRAVIDAATPGPWQTWQYRQDETPVIATPNFVYNCWTDLPDRVFIAAARTRWTAALDEIERLQRENAALRAQVAGHAERIAAQSELLSKKAEK